MLKLNPEERIYLLKRRHWIVLFFQLFPFIIFSFLILTFFLFLIFQKTFLSHYLIEIFPQFLNLNTKIFSLFLLSLILPFFWITIFSIITSYHLTYWIVTNQRTIYVKLNGFFNAKYASVFHDRIQDITLTIDGFFPSVFNFGNLKIQTAGESGQFDFDSVSDPEIIKQIILEAKKDYEHQKI